METLVALFGTIIFFVFPMDKCEQFAKRYLDSLDIGEIVFEPDGNIPPDFLVGDGIAVEVRKLNQNWEGGNGKYEGLDELGISLQHKFQKLFSGIGQPVKGETWFVDMDFKRPINIRKWRVIKKNAKQKLLLFIEDSTRKNCHIEISKNITFTLFKAYKDHGKSFLLGGGSDGDSGGFVFGELERNIKICVNEKETKIEPFRLEYNEWWLILVDYISYGIDGEDREIFKRDIMKNMSHRFNKIVLLDPRENREAYEL